jgi:molybdenum cofactor cytidylyltransferase
VTVGVVLLAGGRAERFGTDKRLALLPDGRTMVMTTIDNIRRAGLPLLVCLGVADNEIEHTLTAEGVPCIKCPDSQGGMGATLGNGIAAIGGAWRGALVGLADMPLIRPATYELVADNLGFGDIVTPIFEGQRGHPVGFGRSYFPRLLALEGDQGARGILSANSASVIGVAVDDPGVLADVDVLQDLQAMSGMPHRWDGQ